MTALANIQTWLKKKKKAPKLQNPKFLEFVLFDTETSSSSYWDKEVLGLLLHFSNQARRFFSESLLQIGW